MKEEGKKKEEGGESTHKPHLKALVRTYLSCLESFLTSLVSTLGSVRRRLKRHPLVKGINL